MRLESLSEHIHSFKLSFHEIEVLLDSLLLARNGLVSRFKEHCCRFHLGHCTGLASLHFSDATERLGDVRDCLFSDPNHLIEKAVRIVPNWRMSPHLLGLDNRTICLGLPWRHCSRFREWSRKNLELR